MKKLLNACLLVLSLSFPLALWAQGKVKIPALSGPIVDTVGIIDRQDERRLAQLLYQYNQSGKAQIQVLVVPTTGPEAIEQYSIRVVDQWKLGTEKQDNGVLFLIAVEDKKMRIEVGQGLEGPLPDITAKRIISDIVSPLFRTGRFAAGVEAAVSEIIFNVDREYADQNLQRPQAKGIPLSAILTLGFCLFVIIASARATGGRALQRGRRMHNDGFGGGFGGGWGGGSGGSGGGGWSGGGGGFSGGGASGGW